VEKFVWVLMGLISVGMFEKLLLGHLLGDYLLQNEWMALNKSKTTFEGWMAAIVHCFLYTFAVCLFMWNFDWIWIVVVFSSHFPIDKFSLAEKYMHYLKGKGMKDYVQKDWTDIVNGIKSKVPIRDINRYDILEGGFTSIVYTLTDNSIHLILMYLAYQIIH
jgi:hypothetical protein